jgi:hypothetical protein
MTNVLDSSLLTSKMHENNSNINTYNQMQERKKKILQLQNVNSVDSDGNGNNSFRLVTEIFHNVSECFGMILTFLLFSCKAADVIQLINDVHQVELNL